MGLNRRQFINSALLATGSALLPETVSSRESLESFPISCNQYDWITFYQRDGKDWFSNLDASLADFASTGLKAYEPGLNTVDDVKKLLPLLQKHKLVMPSVYVNSSLHEHDEGQKSIQTVLSIADALKPVNTKIVVTNPNPIQWGGQQNKSDSQLTEQAKNLDLLGAELKKRGMTLAYHTHDVELRAAGREFHHMLLATSPQNVSLCLDVHWVYRGSGDSQVALFDIVKLYGKRIVELHLRQSKGGIWQETFGEGDIDYKLLMSRLKEINIKPHLVIEQCLEKTSPKTMNAVEAHKINLKSVSELKF
ncbi:sugar phosphate isomerase/epimerase family protein [Dyadobacter subterraneus]|uniref:Sugar phosphate isomerase/epimerase n=1 Tax=Dyadobacter subterraneus TaxID=2773304 RepID=A0ABR9WH68_9BACT|nr:sugar phosphate isomerase/epimerase [Dyadobacter subterraneus]MBE9464843.1 sugar phosphate isomerase/epimerase [Dyadobacter subterraneus]